MPPAMKFSSAYSSPGGSIETGNRLGNRPVVRQSKFYRENESGNGMKGVLGHDHLAWDAQKQEGVPSCFCASHARWSCPRTPLMPLPLSSSR